MGSSDADDDVDDLPRKPLEICCDTASTVGISWAFSLFVASLAGYAAFSMTRGELNWSRDWPILCAFVILLPSFAVFLISSSVWATLLWRKQGKSVLHIPAGFVVEGETTRGSIVCSRYLALRGPARLRLECLERRTLPDRKDGGTRTETRVVLSQEQKVEPEPHGAVMQTSCASGCGTYFPFEMRIPELSRVPEPLPEARGVVSKTASVQWKLVLEAPTTGLDFQAHFDLIILPKAQSD